MSGSKGFVAAGASLVRRHQPILWWVFAVNLILALLGGGPVWAMLSPMLGHSIASGEISRILRVERLVELLRRPEISLPAGVSGAIATQIVFFIFMLFLTGGILVAYREDRKLSWADFFESCGLYFWRMVRLMLISLIPFGICMGIYQGVRMIGDKIAEATPVEATGFWWRMFCGIVVLVLLLFVRLWFDVAQVRAVAQKERCMWKNTFRAWSISWHALGTLLWIYFRIGVVACAVLVVGLWLWLRIPGHLFFLSFLLLEIVTLVQCAVRLWLRASSVAWYQAHAGEPQAAAVECTAPSSVAEMEPSGQVNQ